MPGTDLYNGAGYSSRTAEFASGAQSAGGSAAYNIKQNAAPGGYQPSSVLSPTGGSMNGQSPVTYSANRTNLANYRA